MDVKPGVLRGTGKRVLGTPWRASGSQGLRAPSCSSDTRPSPPRLWRGRGHHCLGNLGALWPTKKILCQSVTFAAHRSRPLLAFVSLREDYQKWTGDRRVHVGVKGIEVYPLADVDSTPGTLWGGTKTQCGQSMTATSLENVAGRFAITVASP